MAYVPVPKDLNAVKTKVLLNLTKRQLVCFSAGAALGVPLFFLLKAHTGVSTAAICMILLMLPFSCWPCMRRTDSPLKDRPQHRAGLLPAPQAAPLRNQ